MTEVSDEMFDAAMNAWVKSRLAKRDVDTSMRNAITAALAARAVRVKALVWQKHNVDGTLWDAPAATGGYVVRFDGKEWLTIKNIVVLARSENRAAAFAAAQSDYEARIFSALEGTD